ncbi:fructose-specific PTS transporter subunit EIIC [Streptomyces umbrinus]
MSPTTSVSPAPMDRHSAPGGRAVARLGRWLSSGTGHLAILTAVGGLLIVLSYAVGNWQITDTTVSPVGQTFSWLQPASWAVAMLQTGKYALEILGLAVAVYTAYGIAGRPALVPAFVAGLTAMSTGTGYFGGLAAGVMAGATTRVFQRITVPAKWRPLMAKAVVPLLATLVTSVVFFSALVAPQLAQLNAWLSDKLIALDLTNHHLVIGLVLGLLVSFDSGGTLYRTATVFAVGGVSSYTPSPAHLTIMAAFVAVGMVPTLGLSLATVVRRKLFTEAERNYAKVSWLLALTSLPEAVIPFALRDPLRVIPASMAGGAVTGVLTMTFGPTMAAPYGGVFVADQLGKPLLMVAAVAAGVLVTAGVAVALKSLRKAELPMAKGSRAGSRAAVPVTG